MLSKAIFPVRVDLFDYELPPELIAQHPLAERDASRLLVLDRATGTIEHRRFHDIVSYFGAGDCLVVNDTKVLPARLRGVRRQTGGKWEGLFLKETGTDWEMMLKMGGKPQASEFLDVESGALSLELISKTPVGTWRVRPIPPFPASQLLREYGHIPIPPYIRQGEDAAEDIERYQTVYAAVPGAVAAPTAGLHFTPRVLDELAAKGVQRLSVTLHVGPGTFQPIKVDDTNDHIMHTEWCTLTPENTRRLQAVRNTGGRIVAVGTTAVRTLEAASRLGALESFEGETDLFIVPPYHFRAVDALVTNFHLPKSTLLMLVCAFGGVEQVLAAYRTAIRERYRFYSYGDAMLIL